MSCHSCNNTPCDSGCSCPQQVKGTCVFYQGANLTCLDATKGDTYDSILATLNTKLCELNPSSGVSTVVDSCNSDISVSSSTVGNETTYTVCLNSDITDQIDTNTSGISDLQNCMTNAVSDIISDTITITEDSQTDCGRTLRLEIPAPSGIPTYDGIIYSDVTKDGTSGGTGEKLLKSFNTDYTQYLNFSTGSEIKIKTTGQIYGDGIVADSVKLQLYDSSGSSVLWESTFSGFDKVNKQSWKSDLILTKTSDTEGLLNVNFFATGKENGISSNFNNITQGIVDAEITGIDYTNLTIKVIYVHNSTSIATYNFARQLTVEVRQLITI